MVNIKKDEIQFLSNLVPKLESAGLKEESKELFTIVERLKQKQIEANERTAKAVAERRKTDPTYGRSQKEIERAFKKLVDDVFLINK